MITIKKYKQVFFVTIFAFIVCGIIYPLLMTVLAQIIFPKQANGSLIKMGDEVVGSELIGQVKTSIDNNGKEHKNVRILSSKLLKAKEVKKEIKK